MKHTFIQLKTGGYFYRVYPKIRGMFKEEEDNLYGQFIFKEIIKKDHIIHFSDNAELKITNTTIGREEKHKLHSSLQIIVPIEIYNYPFIDGGNYILTYDQVIPIKEFTPQSGDSDKLKTIYRTLSKKYHPDHEGGSTVAMQVLNEFFNALKS